MKIILIRHGEPNYKLCEERGFTGFAKELAPLTERGITQAKNVSNDRILSGSELILSSPYPRALQTAAIISKNTGLTIKVEMDLHELIIDKTFLCSDSEMNQLNKDFILHKGNKYNLCVNKWETIDEIIDRVIPTLEKYLTYKKIIVITHGGIIRRFTGNNEVKYCTPYMVEFNKNFMCYRWV